MTLTVDIKFKSDLTLPEVFAICQKAVNTPKGVKGEVSPLGIVNPICGADCAMGVARPENGEYRVFLDIPYVAAGKMHSIAQRALNSLSVTEYRTYNEWEGTWHDNLDWLKPK